MLYARRAWTMGVVTQLQRQLIEHTLSSGGSTMKTKLALLIGATCLVLSAAAYAHHPFSAEYDWTKPVTLTGTVTKLEWTNPHAMLYMEGKDQNGQMKKWTLEMGS